MTVTSLMKNSGASTTPPRPSFNVRCTLRWLLAYGSEIFWRFALILIVLLRAFLSALPKPSTPPVESSYLDGLLASVMRWAFLRMLRAQDRRVFWSAERNR